MTFDELVKAAGITVSEEQMKAIMADSSAVVSAGAGSGKTTVLSLRFVRLVLEGKAHSDEILTLTFTKKAAAEMYERIYMLLSLASAHDPAVAEDLSAHFAKARISTMDSFWSEIARLDCLRFGVTRDFQSLEADDSNAENLVRRVYEEVQGREDLEEGFMILSSICRTDELVELFSQIAISETDILTSFDGKQNAENYRTLIDILESAYAGHRAGYIFSSLASLDQENPENGQHREIIQALEAYDDGDYSSLPSFNLNKLRKARDKELKDFIKDENVKEYFEILQSLAEIKKTVHDSEAVSRVLEAFINEFQQRKRIMGLLSYRDTESLCREILLSNNAVRDYYKKHFRYIMVDEFQDNNSRQRDLLYLLSEKLEEHSASIPPVETLEHGKLFFVGDDKQSIYYFRGADVSVFRSLKSAVVRMNGVNLSLSANYRSEPALINHFNSLFPEVFNTGLSPEDEEKEALMENLTGEEYTSFYADSETIKSRNAKDGVCPCIETAAISSEREEGMASSDDSEAMFIARKILSIVSTDGYLIPDGKGGVKRPSFSDIAVLLRTTAPQMPIERAFRLCSIPYVVQESTASTIEGVGWDFYAFLQLLVYPEDRLAYLALLRSPFARISDEGLLLCTETSGPAFSTDPPFTISSDKEAYENLKALYAEMRGLAGRRRITYILSRIFNESGYGTYLKSSKYLSSYIDHFSYIWAAADSYDSNGHSLAAFLDYLRPLIGQAEKLRNASVQHLESDGVQIMTIHRSKGLQFPVVIIADADHGSGNQGQQGHLISLQGTRPCIMPDLAEGSNIIIREIAAYRKRREEAELRRLLYVAMTRAVDHLIITAHMRKRRGGVSLMDIYLESGGSIDLEIPPVFEEEFFREEEEMSPSSFYSQPVAPEPLYSQKRVGVKDASKQDGGEILSGEKLPSLLSDEVVRNHSMQDAFGTMVHSMLESLMKGEDVTFEIPSELSDLERDRILESLDAIKAGFISSDFYRNVISGHRTAQEVRFYYPSDGKVLEGSADLVVFGDEWNLVVDYKTDSYMNEDVHRAQITAYAKAMEDLYKKKCLAILLYIRGFRESTYLDSSGNPVRGI